MPFVQMGLWSIRPTLAQIFECKSFSGLEGPIELCKQLAGNALELLLRPSSAAQMHRNNEN